jgi:uncharacterized Zn finger protein
MFLVSHREIEELKQEFIVMGSTGNLYTVIICQTPNCDCPDFQRGHLCKHIVRKLFRDREI